LTLLLLVQNRGDRMGGATGMRFIRSLGKPAFVSSPAMLAPGCICDEATSAAGNIAS